ncbi:hypothetical protein L596_027117 [Steinernema carpocapsae]|uniref:Uncharacterized protein n=1 Tax=Steinernema carpocapsae TaxID=34508 RepID=A0A4U5M3D9_STECR|nr:hypothetical protein L596_027117 [Steinernema carpocapsae]
MFTYCLLIFFLASTVVVAQNPAYILPEHGSDNWKVCLLDNLDPVSNLSDIGADFKIHGIYFTESCVNWQRFTLEEAGTILIPFLQTHLAPNSSLQILGDNNDDLKNVANPLLRALADLHFSKITLGYYGPFSEQFVYTQVKTGQVSDLTLTGSWPNGAADLVKTYLTETLNPRLTLTEDNQIPIDKDLFMLMFQMFVDDKLTYLRDIFGKLEIKSKDLVTLRPDLQSHGVIKPRIPGYPVFAWKTAANPKLYFVVQFLENQVEVYTIFRRRG